MRITLLLLASLTLVSGCSDEASLPSGKWQAFQNLGLGGNAVLIMSIDEKGKGFYGYSFDGYSPASCFPINKTTMKKRNGYFEILHRSNKTDFVAVMSEKILNTGYTAMTSFTINNTISMSPAVWSLVPVKGDFLDQKIYQRCVDKTMAKIENQ